MKVIPLLKIFLGCMLYGANAKAGEDGSCPILTILPFSHPKLSNDPDRPSGILRYIYSNKTLGMLGFSYLAAAQIAMNDWNVKSSVIVPELSEVRNCDANFTAQVIINTQSSLPVTLRNLVDRTDVNNGLPCAVLGPLESPFAMPVAAYTGSLNIPQMIFFDDDPMVIGPPNSNTVGMVLGQEDTANAMLQYLSKIGRNYLLNLYGILVELLHHSGAIQRAALENTEVVVRTEEFNVDPLKFERDLDEAKKEYRAYFEQYFMTGYKTIHISVRRPLELLVVADVLDELGMLENEYLYIFQEDVLGIGTNITTTYAGHSYHSAISRLLQGSLIFSKVDGFAWNKNDPFLAHWRNQTGDLVEMLNNMNPLSSVDEGYFKAEANFFQTHEPMRFASYVYDSIIAIGLGACHAKQDSMNNEETSGQNSFVPQMNQSRSNLTEKQQNTQGSQPMPPRTDPHIFGILKSSFTGASGRVRFTLGPFRQRIPEGGPALGAFNIRAVPVADGGSGITVTYEYVLTSVYTNGEWQDIPGEYFTYRDGTTTVPGTAIEIFEKNYLSPWVRALGFSLLGLSWLLGFGGMTLVWFHREAPIVRASQAVFLMVLCAGSIILGTSILTLSFDEGMGWNQKQLNVACTLTPWFFFLGYIVSFTTLFVSLWRVNRVLQFRRRKVTIKSVMWPLLLFVLAAVGILVAWTVADPWVWERQIINDLPAESYGECTCTNWWAFFGPLTGLMIAATAMTAFMAWKTSDVPEEIRDGNLAAYTIFLHLQAWFIGLPILAVLGNSSSDATYLARVLLISIFSMSPVGVIVWPKIYKLYFGKKFEPIPRVRVSGIHGRGMLNVSSMDVSKDRSQRFSDKAASSEIHRNGSTKDIPPQGGGETEHTIVDPNHSVANRSSSESGGIKEEAEDN